MRIDVNKEDLIKTSAEEKCLMQAQASQVVELFFGKTTKALAKGDRVETRRFCSLHTKEYKGCTGRNAKTGALTQVTPKKLPFFKCGKELGERVDR
jgi:integration host factor subunit beta